MLSIEQDPHGRILDGHGEVNICGGSHRRICHGRRVMSACVGLSDFSWIRSVVATLVADHAERQKVAGKSTGSFVRFGSAIKELEVMLHQALMLMLSVYPTSHSFEDKVSEDKVSVSHFYF
jgi:hypothetical protein